ncbi:MAG: hypothetical protein ICV78_15010 [Tolypothrix sp. Co-bin9]|nr:hypothetical protein [Tolypothrix sp. Co-bin9]
MQNFKNTSLLDDRAFVQFLSCDRLPPSTKLHPNLLQYRFAVFCIYI